MQHLEQFRASLQRRHYSENSILHYIRDLQIFESVCENVWLEVTKHDVVSFVHFQTENGFKPSTINRCLQSLKGF